MSLQPPAPPAPEALRVHDTEWNLSPTEPRFDDNTNGFTELYSRAPQTAGPRQRRFEFDAKVIRDSIVRKLDSVGRQDLSEALDRCHRTPSYKKCVGCRHVRTFYNRCERFYCPICAARLARDRRETVAWWSKVVGQPKHVVLTVRSVPVLTREYVRTLKDDLRKMRSQAWASKGEFIVRATTITPSEPRLEPMPGRRRRRNRLSVWTGRELGHKTTKWRGGFWSIDATLNQTGWHIHFHCIVDADFIDVRRLEQAWAKLRGQDEAIVRVYDVRGKDYVNEACKYVCDGVQLGNWPAEKLAEFAESLSDEKLFGTFGCLYKQRAEFSKEIAEIHKDRDVCACGCRQWTFYSESEWEWQQIKSDLSPPPTPRPAPPIAHPSLF